LDRGAAASVRGRYVMIHLLRVHGSPFPLNLRPRSRVGVVVPQLIPRPLFLVSGTRGCPRTGGGKRESLRKTATRAPERYSSYPYGDPRKRAPRRVSRKPTSCASSPSDGRREYEKYKGGGSSAPFGVASRIDPVLPKLAPPTAGMRGIPKKEHAPLR
jgi:hypothetical protein